MYLGTCGKAHLVNQVDGKYWHPHIRFFKNLARLSPMEVGSVVMCRLRLVFPATQTGMELMRYAIVEVFSVYWQW